MFPTSSNQLIAVSRAQIEKLRRAYGNREDFDHIIKTVIDEALKPYEPKVRRFTLKALGLGD